MLIAPSMLASDFSRLAVELKRMEDAGADWIHLDVMDGQFVPNITFGAPIVAAMRPHSALPFDVHLMITDPGKYVADLARAGAQRIGFHLEAEGDPVETIARIRAAGASPTLTIKPGTPARALLPLLPLVDMVLVMTVEPGFGGQSFMADMLQKVRVIKAEAAKTNPSLLVEIDGGVNEGNIALAAQAGADVCVAGIGVFRAEDAGAAIAALKNAAGGAL